MKPRTQAIAKEFERRLREVWRTVVRTNEELATLEHQARASSEEAGTASVTGVLDRLDTAERRLLDQIDAARARLAAGTFGTLRAVRKIDPARATARVARGALVCRLRARRRTENAMKPLPAGADAARVRRSPRLGLALNADPARAGDRGLTPSSRQRTLGAARASRSAASPRMLSCLRWTSGR